MKSLNKIIFVLFGILFFLVPLILWPFTSEVFEFNKIIVTYISTVAISAVWVARMVIERKFIFRRTMLDIPLLVFLCSQLLSTISSIDPRTSILGYYSRFNGGLLSLVSYSLLYWAFVSNIDSKKALRLLYITFISAALVCTYAVLQRFGIDKDIWVQDVVNRVFSTLGQPNWLATWEVALIPVSWMLALKKGNTKTQNYLYLAFSSLLFAVLLLTKSRSGLLGFGVAAIIFWTLEFLKHKKEILKPLIFNGFIFIILTLLIGTILTPSLFDLVKEQSTKPNEVMQNQGPALETGGTESGAIRTIVWKGAIDIWKHYPLTGSGVETFAFSYYMYRPVEHNLVSEWDFIYNKAHNEYLNFMATTGTLGIASYLFLIGTGVFLLYKKSQFGFLAGYASIVVSNFFGFSVVPTQLQLFLFPAFAIALGIKDKEDKENTGKPTDIQKIAVGGVTILASILVILTLRYWYADTLYAKAKANNEADFPANAQPLITRAIAISPNEALYHSQLSETYTKAALALSQNKEAQTQVEELIQNAVNESQLAVSLSPNNLNLKRAQFGMYIRLSLINPQFLSPASDVLKEAIKQAPTDAKLYYNLGLTYARLDQIDLAIETMVKTIELKPNYKEARLAYALFLINIKETEKAKEQLNYILTNIDPNDRTTKETLQEL